MELIKILVESSGNSDYPAVWSTNEVFRQFPISSTVFRSSSDKPDLRQRVTKHAILSFVCTDL